MVLTMHMQLGEEEAVEGEGRFCAAVGGRLHVVKSIARFR